MKKIIYSFIILSCMLIGSASASDKPEILGDFGHDAPLADMHAPFINLPGEWELVYHFKTAAITIDQYVLKRTQTLLTIYEITDVDSAENIEPTFGSNAAPGEYFDATLYNNAQDTDFTNSAKDTILYGVTVDGEEDSARVILLGAYDVNVTSLNLDTLVTNKTTFIQRPVLSNDAAGKYICPYWGFRAEGIDCADVTIRVYVINVIKR